MTRAELLAELKVVLRESTVDAAWGDTRLLEFLAEAQDRFCEDTGFFIDKRTYTVTTVDGTAAYALNDRIIKVMEVWDGNRKIGKHKQADKDPYNRVGVAVEFPQDTGGSPRSWQTDEETGYITIYPTPDANSAGTDLTLRVWRYALNYLADASAEPEIPRQFHRGLIEYACYLALTDHDFEIEDEVKANEHFVNYEYYMRKGITAFNRKQNAAPRSEPALAYVVN
jgi:hypothetical protein